MKHPIPPEALMQHISVLGKTGSGKTSTAKLIVEHVVSQGARVCILDPVKSDWWGLTSSADGKRPGLPFQILGGPHGHVPLHDGAGSAIGELVAGGSLPLSIVDMAEFGPGGQSRFFAAFAPALMRHMRGVLYLVMEEAHEFAPKERAGHSEENMALHFAKKLATAGRSKGVRLVVCTQRVQALHNAILGSCDTLIVHRMTAPADQAPVVTWLKGTVKDKARREQIEQSLPQLKTGQGWICSGEAQLLELAQFPRIQTFDNSKTPDHGDDAARVVTAAVDVAALRKAVGDAVKDAEDNDPKLLKERIRELEKQTRAGSADDTKSYSARNEGFQEGKAAGERDGFARGLEEGQKRAASIALSVGHSTAVMRKELDSLIGHIEQLQRAPLPTMTGHVARPLTDPAAGDDRGRAVVRERTRAATSPETRVVRGVAGSSPDGMTSKPMPRAFLIALAQHPRGLTKGQVRIHTGYSDSGPVSTCFAQLAAAGYTQLQGALLTITPSGLAALGPYDPLPQGAALRELLLTGNRLSRMEKALLAPLFDAYPDTVAKGRLRDAAGYSDSGPVSSAFAKLVALGYAEKAGQGLCAARELFE